MHDKIKKIFDNGLKVYPVIRNYKFAICIEDNYNSVYKKKKTVGEFKHTTQSINKAMYKTIDFLIKKIVIQKH